MIIFETERLLVRRYTLADKDHFYALNGNEEVVRYIRPVKTREESDLALLQAIAYSEAEKLYGRWAVESKKSGTYVGSFAVIPVEGKEEMQLGYALLPPHWGKGYATELARAGLDYVFTKTPLDPIHAYAEVPNHSSQKVLLKVGFQRKGSHTEGNKEIAGFLFRKEDYLVNKATF